MEQKTLGKIQVVIGIIFLLLFVYGLFVSMAVGQNIIESLLKGGPVTLLFGIFALITGWYNLKK